MKQTMKHFLKNMAPNRRMGFKVRSGLLKGSKVYANPSAGENPYWMGGWEAGLQDYFSSIATEGFKPTTFYDLGAHIGYFSMVVGKLFPETEVICFEPDPDNYATITKHRKANPDFCRNLTALPFGVGENSGNFKLKTGLSSFSNKVVESNEDGIKIYCVSLDTAVYELGLPGPDLIKMDIEGMEGPALRGALRVMKEFRPRMVIEIHGPKAAAEVDEVLLPLGVQIRSLEADRIVESTSEIARDHFSIVFDK